MNWNLNYCPCPFCGGKGFLQDTPTTIEIKPLNENSSDYKTATVTSKSIIENEYPNNYRR